MANGKLSQQLQTSRSSQQGLSSNRVSRTDRLKVQAQQRREREKFEALKAEARRIQEEQFKDKTVKENYFEYRPSKYSEKQWASMRSDSKEAILRQYSRGRGLDYYANKGDLIKTQKTRDKTVKFTFEGGENNYVDIYGNLSPEIKQFFASPDELRAEKATRIEDTTMKLQERKTFADQKIAKAEAEYKKDLEWSRNKNWRNSDERRAYERRIDDEKEEEVARWRGYKEGIGKGLGELSRGKDLDFGDIINYADDLGRYEEDREKAKNKNREIQRKEQKKIEDAVKEVETGGGRFERITEYKNGVAQGQKVYAVVGGKYTLLSQQKANTNLSSLGKPSELGKANVSQSYNLGGKKITFKGIEKLYTSPKGELVTVFGSLGTKESDVLASQDAALKAAEREREKKASAYLASQGFETKAVNQPQKTSTFGKIVDYAKTLYAITPFGTSLKMPDSYLEKRKPISFSGSPVGIGISGVNIYSLDPSTAYEGVKAQRRKTEEAKLQSELVGELGDLTEKAPEEIQYEVQQRGLNILKGRGLDTTFDEKTGLIKFTSPALKPSKTYNFFSEGEFQKEKQDYLDAGGKVYFTRTIPETPERKGEISLPYQTRGTAIYDQKTGNLKAGKTPYTIPAIPARTVEYTPVDLKIAGNRGRIVATKAAEIFLIGKGVGLVLGGITKGGSAVYSGLGGGLKVTDATLRAGRVTATVQQTAGLGKIGSGLKIAGTGALFVGGAGLYTAGKIQQKKAYEEQYGDIGKEVFKYETIGELVGIGALIGEGVYKRNQAKKLQQRIAQENYLRQQKAERLRNIKLYGQNSRYAQVSYKGAGSGRISGRKLSEKQVTEFANLYAEATGTSKAKATTIIKESGLYKQTLKVGSPAGFKPYQTDKFALVTSTKSSAGSKEIAFEFTKRGSRVSNVVIKATSGKGKYALTSVFEKARYSPLQPDKNLRLQQTVISKVVKGKSVQVADGYNIKAFKVENRLVKYLPYGKERLATGEALRVGLPKYSQTDLAKIFIRAGKSARTSPLPITNIRLETPAFRNIGNGIKISKEGYYDFAQAGRGGRQVAIKNILKDINFRNLETALRGSRTKTPLSVTFGSEVTQSTKGATTKGFSSKAATSAVTKAAGLKASQLTVKNVAISPTVQADLKIRVTTKLLSGTATATAPASRTAVTAAIAGALGLRSRQQLRTELKSKQVTQQAQTQQTQQRQQQQQQQRQRSASQSIQTFSEPTINIRDILPNITRPPRPARPARPAAFAFGNLDYLEKKLRQKRAAKGKQQAFLLPDFATRILGLEPQKVGSTKEALREIRKIKTGLELRRGLIVQ